MAAAGPKIRELTADIPSDLKLADGFREPRCPLPGVLAIQAPAWTADVSQSDVYQSASLNAFCERHSRHDPLNHFPLIVLTDDSEFTARNFDNFLWVTFTRSNPAVDIGGIESFYADKHWGCRGSLIIDARVKTHHAPALETDPEMDKRVDARAARGGPLAAYL
jgi:4-hydroxy-3-polyprenylbenzoate decarboxylase